MRLRHAQHDVTRDIEKVPHLDAGAGTYLELPLLRPRFGIDPGDIAACGGALQVVFVGCWPPNRSVVTRTAVVRTLRRWFAPGGRHVAAVVHGQASQPVGACARVRGQRLAEFWPLEVGLPSGARGGSRLLGGAAGILLRECRRQHFGFLRRRGDAVLEVVAEPGLAVERRRGGSARVAQGTEWGLSRAGARPHAGCPMPADGWPARRRGRQRSGHRRQARQGLGCDELGEAEMRRRHGRGCAGLQTKLPSRDTNSGGRRSAWASWAPEGRLSQKPKAMIYDNV